MSRTFASDYLHFPFNDESESEYKAHKKMLKADRRLAMKKPFYSGLPLDCNLIIPPVSKTPGARPLPRFAAKNRSNSPVPFTLRLGRQLRFGLDKWSQIWCATTVEQGSTSESLTMAPNVILKIIQPSLCQVPEDLSEVRWSYRCPERIAKHEAEFYDVAKDLQGGVIPYFFGIQQVKAPSGELSWVLFLEYIDGPALEDFIEETQSRTGDPDSGLSAVINDIYKNALSGAEKIHAKSLYLRDLQSTNIVLSLPSHVPVFIDFAFTRFGIEGTWFKAKDQDDLDRIFGSWPVYGPGLNDYLKKHPPIPESDDDEEEPQSSESDDN